MWSDRGSRSIQATAVRSRRHTSRAPDVRVLHANDSEHVNKRQQLTRIRGFRQNRAMNLTRQYRTPRYLPTAGQDEGPFGQVLGAVGVGVRFLESSRMSASSDLVARLAQKASEESLAALIDIFKGNP